MHHQHDFAFIALLVLITSQDSFGKRRTSFYLKTTYSSFKALSNSHQNTYTFRGVFVSVYGYVCVQRHSFLCHQEIFEWTLVRLVGFQCSHSRTHTHTETDVNTKQS